MAPHRILLMPLLLIVALASPTVLAFTLTGTVWERVSNASSCKAPPLLLYSLAIQESRHPAGRGLITPHPFALRNAISGSKYPDSQDEAAQLLQRYIQEDPLTDVGMMQINLRWNGARVKSPEMLLDPETNIAVAAQILCEALSVKRNDIELGIGGYHTMNPEREADARAYARNVLMIWRSLQALEKSGS